jgi:hypothetical protein
VNTETSRAKSAEGALHEAVHVLQQGVAAAKGDLAAAWQAAHVLEAKDADLQAQINDFKYKCDHWSYPTYSNYPSSGYPYYAHSTAAVGAGLSVGSVVGIVAGAVVLVAAIAGFTIYRRKQNLIKKKAAAEFEENEIDVEQFQSQTSRSASISSATSLSDRA